MNQAGILYIVATPIGNRDDITLRALEILKSVDLIACEDTRHSGSLLAHYGIKKSLVSYFQHSKLSKVELIVLALKSGKNIALITDAGTPGISDPGQALVAEVRSSNIEVRVVPVPGPSALAAIASVSGLIEKEFYFAGFLPKKKGRQTKFKELSNLEIPIVVYESANRLEKTLEDIRTYFGANAEVFIGREMTKMFEEYWGGKVEEVLADLPSHQLKGEIALVVKKSNS